MKKFLTIAILTGIIFYLIMTFRYDGVYHNPDPEAIYPYRNVSNALFLVGLPLFLLSVLMLSGASDIFTAFHFTFKKMFSRGDSYVGMTITEYKESQKQRMDTTGIAIAGILVSLIFNGISLYFAYAPF